MCVPVSGNGSYKYVCMCQTQYDFNWFEKRSGGGVVILTLFVACVEIAEARGRGGGVVHGQLLTRRGLPECGGARYTQVVF